MLVEVGARFALLVLVVLLFLAAYKGHEWWTWHVIEREARRNRKASR